MYEYLEDKGLEVVAVCYVYGDILRFLKVLVLEPVGRTIRPDDLTDHNISKIRSYVTTLNDYKLLHGNIQMENFCIDESENVGHLACT